MLRHKFRHDVIWFEIDVLKRRGYFIDLSLATKFMYTFWQFICYHKLNKLKVHYAAVGGRGIVVLEREDLERKELTCNHRVCPCTVRPGSMGLSHIRVWLVGNHIEYRHLIKQDVEVEKNVLFPLRLKTFITIYFAYVLYLHLLF